MANTRPLPKKPAESGEFLWLVSLSDLMILLFVFFVVLFSFTYKKLKESDFKKIVASFKNEKHVDPIETIGKQMKDWVKEQKLTEMVEVKQDDEAVIMEIKDKLLFGSGDAEPHIGGKHVISRLAKTLEKVPAPYRIGIEGHTDDTPIHTKQIRDNWELSSKRALSVFYTMNFPPALLQRSVVLAHGDTQPLVPNRGKDGKPIPQNQARNRRVTLRIF